MKYAVMGIGLALAAGLGFTVMGGGSWLDAMIGGEERVVRKRIEDYWQARVERDYQRLVKYAHPLQKTVPAPGMLQTESFEIKEIQFQGDEAVAHVSLETRLRHPILSRRGRKVELRDKWVRHDGVWYKALGPVGYGEIMEDVQGKWRPPQEPAADGATHDQGAGPRPGTPE